MFYVSIFQLFFTFVSYKCNLVAEKHNFLNKWSQMVSNYFKSDVVTQQSHDKNKLMLYLLNL